ncbi:MAG: hypothetical protein H6550_02640 [Chitinophagales bacterium]|nr:hypothetical protein [Chitinophagales bacterium]
MKIINSLLVVLLLTLCTTNVTAQYDYVELSLRIQRNSRDFSYYELNMHKTGEGYYIDVKQKSAILNNEIADTVLKIDKDKFDKITQLALSISSTDILEGMDPSDVTIYDDATNAVLTLKVGQEKVIYSILAPKLHTKNRKLKKFVQTCEEVLVVAKINPKDAL